jgi:predicted  nucleic acid-binding Zn-ribbon protein
MMGEVDPMHECDRIKELEEKLRILERKQEISHNLIQDFRRKVSTLHSENESLKTTIKESLRQGNSSKQRKDHVDQLRKDLEEERSKTSSLKSELHVQQKQLNLFSEMNKDLSRCLEEERTKVAELTRDFEAHVRLVSEVGNAQLGKLKTKTEMIHSLETSVIQTFQRPLRLFWNTVVEKDILKLNQSNWVPDSESFACHDCQKPFGLVNRRHHCRKCGNVYCSDHLQLAKISILEKVADPEGVETKICKSCIPLIQHRSPTFGSFEELIFASQ